MPAASKRTMSEMGNYVSCPHPLPHAIKTTVRFVKVGACSTPFLRALCLTIAPLRSRRNRQQSSPATLSLRVHATGHSFYPLTLPSRPAGTIVIRFTIKKVLDMCSRWSFLLVLFCISIAAAQTQKPAPNTTESVATLKSKSLLVLVDVVVTNDKGDPIPGLQKKDFEVLEDGKPQTIANFEEHHAAAVTQIQLPPLPPHVYTNFPLIQSADSVNVILLDALNTPTRDQVYVRAQMLKYLKTIAPGTRVAIFTLASQLRMLQGVTTDSTQLLAALNSSKGPQQSGLLPSAEENEANDHFVDFLQQEDMGGQPATRDLAAVDPVQVAKQFMADTATFQTEQRIGITLDAMQHLALYLAGVPGRKNVIWFSGSFPTGIFGDPDLPDPLNIASSFQDEIRKTTDLLASAQLALYPVAAEGLASDAVYQANGKEIGEKRPSMAIRDQLKEMQSGETTRDLNHTAMEDLAKDTGGQAYYNTNGLSGALARVVNNGSRYYSLTYSPSYTTRLGGHKSGHSEEGPMETARQKNVLTAGQSEVKWSGR
jgi:VWFA-related protein